MEYLWAICTLLVGHAESIFRYYTNAEIAKQALNVIPFYMFACLLVYLLIPVVREALEYMPVPEKCEKFYRSIRDMYELGTPGRLSDREIERVEEHLRDALKAHKEAPGLRSEISQLRQRLENTEAAYSKLLSQQQKIVEEANDIKS